MSKYIKLTEEMRRQTHEELDRLMQENIPDGKLSFTKLFVAGDRKATILFSERAWLRMGHLIAKCSKEVAWHGVARRGDDETKDEYIIDDIMVYPQEVTGSTVNTDQEKYQTWLMSQPDEVFNNLRMQGHSHVNMGVTPSSVDLEHQRKIFAQLEGDMFYIFMIWNKRMEKNIWVYDFKKNILFETSDCQIDVLPGPLGLKAFLEEADTMVVERTPAVPPAGGYGGNYGYGGGYGGNYGGGYQKPSAPQTPAQPAQPAAAKQDPKNADNKSAVVLPSQKKRTTVSDYGSSRAAYGYDDEDDPYYGYD